MKFVEKSKFYKNSLHTKHSFKLVFILFELMFCKSDVEVLKTLLSKITKRSRKVVSFKLYVCF